MTRCCASGAASVSSRVGRHPAPTVRNRSASAGSAGESISHLPRWPAVHHGGESRARSRLPRFELPAASAVLRLHQIQCEGDAVSKELRLAEAGLAGKAQHRASGLVMRIEDDLGHGQ